MGVGYLIMPDDIAEIERCVKENIAKVPVIPARWEMPYQDQVIEGMRYRIYWNRGDSGIAVVNLTKDKMECELMAHKINQIKANQ